MSACSKALSAEEYVQDSMKYGGRITYVGHVSLNNVNSRSTHANFAQVASKRCKEHGDSSADVRDLSHLP